MCISNKNVVIMTILLVYVFHICFAPLLDVYGKEMCVEEINKVFKVKREYPTRKHFAKYAIKYLREDDTCFLNASNNTTYNYAKRYYQTIRENKSIIPGVGMLSPNDYCDSDPFAGTFHVYYDPRVSQMMQHPVQACKTQMALNNIPDIVDLQQILNWIYDYMLITKLNTSTDTYVIHYVKTCANQINASGITLPKDFCETFNTVDGPPLYLGFNLGTMNINE